jgi:hypothetical protein
MDSTKILYQKGDVKYSTDYFEKKAVFIGFVADLLL